MVFLDRRDAVRQLAEQLIALKGEDPVVIALPPGGVPVAFEVAQRLGAPLDGLPVGSAPAPGNSQLAAGATTEDGVVALDAPTEPVVSMTDDLFDAAFARERRMLRLRAAGYRSGRPSIDVRGRTVIVVDDGSAHRGREACRGAYPARALVFGLSWRHRLVRTTWRRPSAKGRT